MGSRFDNAQDAASAWQRALDVAASSHPEIDPDEAAAAATLATPLAQAGLSPNALVGTRAVRRRHRRGPARARPDGARSVAGIGGVDQDRDHHPDQGVAEPTCGRDVRRLAASTPWSPACCATSRWTTPAGRAVRVLLGQPDQATGTRSLSWPTTNEVSNELDLSRSDVTAAWRSFLASRATQREAAGLRGDLVEVLRSLGGVGSAAEVSDRVVAGRGSYAEDPLLTAQALAVVRVAVECDLAGHRDRRDAPLR